MGEFKDNLRALRKSKGLTQDELARAVGITASSICQYEIGKRQPDHEGLLRIAKTLDTTVGELLGEEIKKEPASTGDELIEILEACKDRSDLRSLFALAKDTPPDEIRKTIAMLKVWKDV